MLKIVKAGIKDIKVIRDITHEVWPSTYYPIVGEVQVNFMLDLFYSPASLEAQMTTGGNEFLICLVDEKPVGFAAFSEVAPDVFKLHKLYILTTVQGRGVGKLLVDHICNDLKSRGGRELKLNVNRYNTPAIGFYRKMGFVETGIEDIEIGNGYFMNDYVFNREL